MLLNYYSYALLLSLQLLFIGCSKPSPEAQNAIDLLSIEVVSSTPKDFSVFNGVIDAAISAGEKWPQEPVMIVRKFLEGEINNESVFVFKKQRENAHYLNFIVINNGFSDDSVAGERIEGTLELIDVYTRNWRITGAHSSRRCWDDRGHQHFSTKPCV